MNPNSRPEPVIGKPPVQSIVRPRAMLSMPSVATNGGSRKRVITKPLNQPSAAPDADAGDDRAGGVNCEPHAERRERRRRS